MSSISSFDRKDKERAKENTDSDEILFADIENALYTTDFQINCEEVEAAVGVAFSVSHKCVSDIVDNFLAKLQSRPEFEIYFKGQKETFLELKSKSMSEWEIELHKVEASISRKLIAYFDSKLSRHAHRVISIRQAMAGKVKRLRESVVQFRLQHEIIGEEKIQNFERMVVGNIKAEKDYEIALLKQKITELEESVRNATVIRLADSSYRDEIINHKIAKRNAIALYESEEVSSNFFKYSILTTCLLYRLRGMLHRWFMNVVIA